jgi:hypothetical protein
VATDSVRLAAAWHQILFKVIFDQVEQVGTGRLAGNAMGFAGIDHEIELLPSLY